MTGCGRSRLFLFVGLPQADRLNDGRHALNGGRSLASPQWCTMYLLGNG